MNTLDLTLLSRRSLNTMMLFCIMLWFASQPSLFVPRTIDHGFIIPANEMYFKPRVPPPLIDPEVIDFEAENVESYRDRLLQN